MTSEQIAALIEELNGVPPVCGLSYEISEELLTRAIAALAEFERDKGRWVAIPMRNDAAATPRLPTLRQEALQEARPHDRWRCNVQPVYVRADA